MTTETLPLEALSPRELLLERAGGVLQRGAFANAIIAAACVILGLVTAGQTVRNWFRRL